MKTSPWRLTLRIIAVLMLVASIVWLIMEPGFEPLLGFLSAVAGLLVSFAGESKQPDDALPPTASAAQAQPSGGLSATKPRVVNLRPLDVTRTFKDRVREINTLCKYLSEDGVRLISVVGRGGMGKTALVCRVLADLEGGVLPVPGEERELGIDGILYLSARSTGLNLDRIYADIGRMLGEPIAGRLAALWANRDIPLVAKVEYLLEAMQDGVTDRAIMGHA